ncbi:hypothetical protein [Neosynechococcus sphagnicola]|uniref:hypothetical protein n=1 Tax=Neosynechococcus sphagnicola TaxID=1501145 RepID=UPI00308469AB
MAQLDPDQVWTYRTRSPEADLWADQLTYSAIGIEGVLHTPQGEAAFHAPRSGAI